MPRKLLKVTFAHLRKLPKVTFGFPKSSCRKVGSARSQLLQSYFRLTKSYFQKVVESCIRIQKRQKVTFRKLDPPPEKLKSYFPKLDPPPKKLKSRLLLQIPFPQPKSSFSENNSCLRSPHASGVLGFSFACGRRPHAKLNRRTERS